MCRLNVCCLLRGKAVHESDVRMSCSNSKVLIDWIEAKATITRYFPFFTPCPASSSRVQERVKGRREKEHRGVGNVARNTQKGDDGFTR